ncbi:MAG: P1 family peptidase [Firmicutes bacterium]|nr:P1 family peptidase [Bacillota bacterium]
MDSLLDVPDLAVGHAQDLEALTGCTVVLCPEGAVAGVDVRGSAPGTRETDLLDPSNLVDRVHAVVLAGGSAFGLDAATGVMRWLEERGYGFDTGVARVPIVPAAVLFDLALGRADVRPDAAMGYAACENAVRAPAPLPQGNVGAGTGASAGKLLGPGLATKTGLGSAGLKASGGLVVGALVAVNAFGDVRDPDTGCILAGTRRPVGSGFLDTAAAMGSLVARGALAFAERGGRKEKGPRGRGPRAGCNTTIGVVATNAELTKAQARKVAQMAHDGWARTITPVHTMFDGDTIFALSYGRRKVRADVTTVGCLAAQAMAVAVKRAALEAEAAGGLPAARDVVGAAARAGALDREGDADDV